MDLIKNKERIGRPLQKMLAAFSLIFSAVFISFAYAQDVEEGVAQPEMTVLGFSVIVLAALSVYVMIKICSSLRNDIDRH